MIGAYLSQALRAKGASVVGEDPGSGAGSLAVELKATLSSPPQTAKTYYYPKEISPVTLAFGYVVPANGQGDVYVCAHRGGKAVGYWKLTDGKNPIEEVRWTGKDTSETLPDGRVRFACSPFLVAARDAMNSAQAPVQGGNK